jgi:hypothetical protein
MSQRQHCVHHSANDTMERASRVVPARQWHLLLIPMMALVACSQQTNPLGNIQTGQVVGGATEQIANVQPVGGFLPNPSLLYAGGTGQPDLVYRNPSVVFSSYDQVLLEPVSVWSGPNATFTNLPPAQRQALADKFYSDLYQTLSTHCALATAARGRTIRLRFALVDATAPNPVLNTVATYTPYASSAYDAASFIFNKGVGYFAGTATAEGYATDANTGTLLWQAVDKRGGTTSMLENTLDNKLDIDHAFMAWSNQLASRLQQMGVCHM